MKLGDGVEQAIHSVTMLAALPDGQVLPASALAEFHGVSTSYLLKHLQSMSREKIVETVPGPRGGYRLNRSPENITLLDVVLAVEGSQPAFRCKEIRQNGPTPLSRDRFTVPCQINAAMLRAERAYRAELGLVSIADLNASVVASDDGSIVARGCAFLDLHARKSS